jgi:hypothetical protein
MIIYIWYNLHLTEKQTPQNIFDLLHLILFFYLLGASQLHYWVALRTNQGTSEP